MSDGHHAGRPQASSSQQASAGKRARTDDSVSSCYMFKSQLQEYAQKAGVPTPVYETTKEGPSHEPFFRSTVIVNEVRYDSLLGFMNRKAAEQSAAEVALMELAKSNQVKCSISQPVHETGLCKNLLQEYAQKMSYAVPLYQHEMQETRNRGRGYQCTVVIGGTKYIGAVATSKKEAEIKAARTAWFAIKESSTELSGRSTENSTLTVIPSRKRVLEAPSVPKETTNTTPQAKKARLNKKAPKRNRRRKNKPKSQVPTEDGVPPAVESSAADVVGDKSCQTANVNHTCGQDTTGVLENTNGDTAMASGVTEDGKLSDVRTPATDGGGAGANIHLTNGEDSTEVLQESKGDTAMASEATEDGTLYVAGTQAPDVGGQEGSHGTNSHHTNAPDLTVMIEDSKGDASVGSGAPEDGVTLPVGNSRADVVGDKGCQTANVNLICGQDSTGVFEDSKVDTTMASGVTEDGKLFDVKTQATDVGGAGANIHLTNGEVSTEILQESKGDTVMANEGALSAAGTQAPDVGGQGDSHGTSIHSTNAPDSIAMIEDSKGDASMGSAVPADCVPSAVVTSAPDIVSDGGGQTIDVHDSNGEDTSGVTKDSKEDAAMVSGATTEVPSPPR